jgi:hypothetical protein
MGKILRAKSIDVSSPTKNETEKNATVIIGSILI